MKKRYFVFGSLIIAFTLLSTACGAKVEPTPTVDPNAVMTEVAGTVSAEMTRIALLTPSPTATLEPTPTIPATPTMAMTLPSDASVPGGTVGTGTPAAGMPASTSVPVATQPVSTADNSAWVADVSVPDGTKFYLNESFTKIWKVKNTGSTTWDNTYSLVNIDGNTWGAKDIIPLTATVQPGQEVQLKISFHAPKVLGEQFSRWKLMNSASQIFGQELYVYIDVDTSAKKTATPAG